LVIAGIILFLKKPFKLNSKKEVLQLSIIGCIVGLHWLTFYMSIQLSTASFGVLCISTATFHVSWLEPLIMKRPFSWVEFGLSLLVVFGIYYVCGDFKTIEIEALFYGLLSGFLAATFAVYNAKLVNTIAPLKITLYEMFAAFILLSIIILSQGKMTSAVFNLDGPAIFWLLFLGVFCTAFAFYAIVDVAKYLGAYTVALSINLEPIYTFVLAIFILSEHEVLNSRFYIGALIIVFVLVLNAFFKSMMKRKNKRLNKFI
jgi:drug/metabolite transporter (DMT)-like permease